MPLPRSAWLIGLLLTAPLWPAQDPSPAPARLLTVRTGDRPIILSAPHGGRQAVPGVPERAGEAARKFTTVRDENTAELAERLAAELTKRLGGKPFLVVARFERKYLDVNRPVTDAFESPAAKPYYDAYHQALADACQEVRRRWGRGLLLDLHGQGANPDAAYRGTGNGKSVKALVERHGPPALAGPDSVLGRLRKAGWDVVPPGGPDEREDPRFNGGHTVQTYGSHQPNGLDAIQLELGGRLRATKRLDQTAAELADAVTAFFKTYLRDL